MISRFYDDNYPNDIGGIEWARQYEEWKMTNKLLTKGALASNNKLPKNMKIKVGKTTKKKKPK